jgi:hypothetical protein
MARIGQCSEAHFGLLLETEAPNSSLRKKGSLGREWGEGRGARESVAAAEKTDYQSVVSSSIKMKAALSE